MKFPEYPLRRHEAVSPFRRLSVRAVFTGIFCVFLLFSTSCRVQLVPEYSQALDEQIVRTAKLNDILYLHMLQDGKNDRNYRRYAPAYLDIEGEINSIRLENDARRPDAHMAAILEALRSHFIEYRNEHKAKETLSDGEIRIYQQQIRAFWLPLLKAERALKDPAK